MPLTRSFLGFLKWTCPSLTLDTAIVANRVLFLQNANSVDPDETAHNELFHLNLHCLLRYLYWPVGLNGFKEMMKSLLEKSR